MTVYTNDSNRANFGSLIGLKIDTSPLVARLSSASLLSPHSNNGNSVLRTSTRIFLTAPHQVDYDSYLLSDNGVEIESSALIHGSFSEPSVENEITNGMVLIFLYIYHKRSRGCDLRLEQPYH